MIFIAASVRVLLLIAARAGFPGGLCLPLSTEWCELYPEPASTDLDTLLSSLLGPRCHST